MLTDTHCHLADPVLNPNLPAIFADAAQAGVCRFIVPATQRSDFDAVLALARHPHVHIALGIHPWFAEAAADADLACLGTLLQQHPRALVGEIGLDFYGKQQTAAQRARQNELLCAQLELAEQHRRPVILHNLKATAAIVAAIRQTGFTQGGIAHAFSGSLEEARLLIGCGLKIGIGSLLLNPTAQKARRAAAELPLAHIMLETDSPFMLKNQTNTPANVRKIAETVATLRGIALTEIAAQTEQNVAQLLAFQTA
ncbi:TatD family hydrolase [Uruburuella testudinis]|uniref:TatD family hydrolase n=1 Tax=Uruburuella testudinis TaxID=1282863 RepID=A0ABY4DV29_9NEIS|nr:TatD family hydrolase [Uruburuella testudinis]UOO82893.1 TatD family hydrolase [Uruburuella testudinis]